MNPKAYTLKTESRLKSKKLFEQVFAKGKSFKQPEITTLYLLAELAHDVPLQVAFTVPKRRFKRAVDRNRLKRLMREAYRAQKHPLEELLKSSKKQYVVVFVYTFTKVADYVFVREKMALALQTLLKHVTK